MRTPLRCNLGLTCGIINSQIDANVEKSVAPVTSEPSMIVLLYLMWQDHCILVLSHEDDVPPFLYVFNHLLPIPNSPFSGALFVFHKHGLLEDIQYRQPEQDETCAIKGFLAGLAGSQEALSKLDDPTQHSSVIAAWVDGCVVGTVVVTEDLDVDALRANFDLRLFPDLNPSEVCKVEAAFMNPIFGHRCVILNEKSTECAGENALALCIDWPRLGIKT